MSGIIEVKKIAEVLDEYEKDLFNEHIKMVMLKASDAKTTITAAKVSAVREIRDRLGVPEIKA